MPSGRVVAGPTTTTGRLVVVAGAPGSGKTTLARELASRLRAPLVAKDDVKEAIADALGSGDRARSRELGAATYAAMRAIARRSLETGGALVIEANFDRQRSEPWLRELARLGSLRVVLCEASDEVRRERFAARAARGERHPVHLDDEILRAEWYGNDRYAIDAGAPCLVVQTTDGYAPSLDEIARFARA